MAFSHLTSHSAIAQRSYTMTQYKAAHALGVRLLWSLDTKGSLVSVSQHSSSIALVSDMHWLSCVSQRQAGRGCRGWWPLDRTRSEKLLPS